MIEQTAADLLTEVRRLRIRLTQLSGSDLGEPASAPVPDGGSAAEAASTSAAPSPAVAPGSRREAVYSALAALAALDDAPAEVPQLGDRVLADQLTVLLADCLPDAGAPAEQTEAAFEIAVALRRALA